MKEVIKDMKAREEHLSKPFATRFYLFFWTKKRRIFYLIMLSYLYYKWTNISNFFSSRTERLVNKYKRRWIQRYNPQAIIYITPKDFDYVPAKLSKQSADRLGQVYVQGDRQLKNGFSRQLTINILTKVMDTG
jgi:hypothetical protein